jgi:hypothetical protein
LLQRAIIYFENLCECSSANLRDVESGECDSGNKELASLLLHNCVASFELSRFAIDQSLHSKAAKAKILIKQLPTI